jgi:hypothetical protein
MKHSVTVELSQEEYAKLTELAELLNLEPLDAAHAVLSVGLAYASQRIDGNTNNPVVSIMLHSLLDIPKLPESLQVH